jgi:hypothetical protein
VSELWHNVASDGAAGQLVKLTLPRVSTQLGHAAAAFVASVRAEFAAGVTGRRWRRKPTECPDWCGGGHYCSAQHGYPSGQHRSEPVSWKRPYGSMVATRVETITGKPEFELRGQIRLSANGDGEDPAGLLAQAILTAVDLAILNLIQAGTLSVTGEVFTPALVGASRPQIASAGRPAVDGAWRGPMPLAAGRQPVIEGVK